MTIQRPAAPAVDVVELPPTSFEGAVPDLADLVVDAVEGGASVNFLAGVTAEQARAWWIDRASAVRDGTVTVFVARDEGARIVGCTLLIRSRNQNSPHRAEIAKVLVHRSVRRQGLGRALMAAAEARAAADRRWLLILDTESGTAADRFYRTLGWTVLGTMPNHAYTSTGVLAPTTFFFKDLRD